MSPLEPHLENCPQVIMVPGHIRMVNAKSRAHVAKTEYGKCVDEMIHWEKKQSQTDEVTLPFEINGPGKGFLGEGSAL